jgi:hypothetical protein
LTFGPYIDFKAPILPGITTINTGLQACVLPSVGLCFIIPDRITIGGIPIPPPPFVPVPLITIKWLTVSIVGDPEIGPTVNVTNIYALDLNPNGGAIMATGFDPSNPQIVPESNEEFFGASGSSYPATVSQTLPISALPGALPGFDLSGLGGAPNSIVYLFQGSLPLVDIEACPEPSGAGIVGLAMIVAALGRRRARLSRSTHTAGWDPSGAERNPNPWL